MIVNRHCSRLRSRGHSCGFTLVELMIALAVAIVLITLAVPSFRELMMSNNVTQTSNGLLTDLNLARSEAVNRGTLVAVISKSGTSNWSSGWSIVVDSVYKNDGTFSDASDVVLGTSSGVDTASNYKVTTKVSALAGGSGISASDDRVIFTSSGSMIPNATQFDINVCRPDSKPDRSKRITVESSGTVNTTSGTASSPAPGC
jgi:type IV fimbrial biogenesis protein FimT